MRSLLTILFFGSALVTSAQVVLQAPEDKLRVTTNYYNKKGVWQKEAEGAFYYTIDSSSNKKSGSYSYYTSNNQLRYRQPFVDDGLERSEEMFYENGQKMWEGKRAFNNSVGMVNMWYDNGKNLAVIEYPTGKREYGVEWPSLIMQYWDSTGTQLVTDGEGSGSFGFPDILGSSAGNLSGGLKVGKWTGKIGDHGTYEETYDRGTLLHGVSTIDGQNYTYTKLEAPAEYTGGLEQMYKYVNKNMTYPKGARKAGIEGSVYVEFVIEKDGAINGVKIIKGIDGECDEVARKVVASFPKWVPGRQRGVPVRVRFVLPLKFVLG